MSDLESLIRAIVRDELSRTTPANDTADYLSAREAATFARASVYSIRRWVRNGKLSKHMAGTRLLVRRDELERLLASDMPGDSIEERVRRKFG